MPITFANLPNKMSSAIDVLLTGQGSDAWVIRAQQLHEKYQSSDRKNPKGYIHDMDDVLGYLGLRVPATFAQLYSSLLQVQEMMPSWQPKQILDLGCGPGTGAWAARSVWDSVERAVCLDENRSFLQVGSALSRQTDFALDCTWIQKDIRFGLDEDIEPADLVIIGNVLNELHPEMREKVLGKAFNCTKGLLVIVESGTPKGSLIVQECARKLQQAGVLVAPYVNNSLVIDESFWLHFSQRFIRPDFQRRVRQRMRGESEMASDWEDAKFSLSVVSKIPAEIQPWGRCVGHVQQHNGYVSLPVLTAEKIEHLTVLKRTKEKYNYAKNVKWGELIMDRYAIMGV